MYNSIQEIEAVGKRIEVELTELLKKYRLSSCSFIGLTFLNGNPQALASKIENRLLSKQEHYGLSLYVNDDCYLAAKAALLSTPGAYVQSEHSTLHVAKPDSPTDEMPH